MKRNPTRQRVGFCESGGQGRDRTGDLPLFRRTLVPTELPGRKASFLAVLATLTGLEPATSAVTGRRANQLRHRAIFCCPPHLCQVKQRTPYGIRTRATALKGRRPRPLDEGGRFPVGATPVGAAQSYDTTPTFPKPAGQRRQALPRRKLRPAHLLSRYRIRGTEFWSRESCAAGSGCGDVGAVEGHRYMVFEGCGCDRAVVGPVGPQDRQA